MKSEKIQCVILAGGRGTRLGELTADRPKAMVLVAGKPFLYHQLQLLRDRGIGDIVICAGYLGDRIEEHFGTGRSFGMKIRYSHDGSAPLGTGGALKKAGNLLEDVFLVLYGDSYLEFDYREVHRRFPGCGAPALMTVFRNRGRFGRDNVVFGNGRVEVFDKQIALPGMEWIDYGLSVLSKELLAEIPSGGRYNLADLYNRLAAEGRLAGYEVTERFYEIGSIEGLRELEAHLRDKGIKGEHELRE